MDILEIRKGSLVVLTLKGKLDTEASTDLSDRLTALIAKGDREFLLDFSGLVYISSSGLRVLLMAAKKLKPSNGSIALSCLQQSIREIFDMSGFSALFTIYPTMEQAIFILRQGAPQ